MNDKILVLFVATLLPSLAIAQEPHDYQCTFGDLQRRVVIFYETGVTVPCEVHYFKDTEAPGETQVLWRALNEAGYCERMAENFVAKLVDLDWSCGPAGDNGGEAAVPEELDDVVDSDDTDALTPAENTEPTEE